MFIYNTHMFLRSHKNKQKPSTLPQKNWRHWRSAAVFRGGFNAFVNINVFINKQKSAALAICCGRSERPTRPEKFL